MPSYEINFDGLVGPTHNYAGLSYGNLASFDNALSVSNPKAAVQQGLLKMQTLLDYGFKQAILPPQQRPNISLLKKLGFSGTPEHILRKAYEHEPRLFSACYSASSMWAANAAMVSPSADTKDSKVHFTPANLITHFHRAQEADFTKQLLKIIFANDNYFVHHEPLPSTAQFSDEGAANHSRFCADYNALGTELFVFGRYGFPAPQHLAPQQFPARQTFEACAAIARLHDLNPDKIIIAQQNPVAIEQGVFHNDVISVGNKNVFLYHQQAFLSTSQVLSELQDKLNHDLHAIPVSAHDISIADAVSSYLFNSQLLSLADNTMMLMAPTECQENPNVSTYLENLIKHDKYIKKIHYINCRQSMRNGGGPACLRLRVVLNDEEISHTHQGVFATKELLQKLLVWSDKHYRDSLSLPDLLDPALVNESNTALNELTQILGLGCIYEFQR